MSITRQQLEAKAQKRFEMVEVEGFGKVGIRTCPQIQQARRELSYTDHTTGNLIEDEHAKSGIHMLIDQLMADEQTPMFTDADFELLSSWDVIVLMPIYAAIRKFNGDEVKNE